MIRVEVVGNRSVQEDFFDRLAEREVGEYHTLLSAVQGVGTSGPRRGDHVWPQENFLYFAYLEEEEARAIQEIVSELQELFAGEGIRFFATPAVDL
ncbi:MAG: PG0541 family transporter-associated protein [Alkalispirochaetaceae bacterium]